MPRADAQRLPNLFDVDLSVARVMQIRGARFTLRAECFNVLSANTELNRVVNASSAAFNRLEEIMAPRIFRLGVRFGF